MEQWLILGVVMLMTGTVAGVLAGLFGIGGWRRSFRPRYRQHGHIISASRWTWKS
jgi:hypothetical protein